MQFQFTRLHRNTILDQQDLDSLDDVRRELAKLKKEKVRLGNQDISVIDTKTNREWTVSQDFKLVEM